MSFQRHFLKNFIAVGIFKYSGILVTFIGTALVSRQLTPKEYAVISVIAIFYGILAIFIDNGLASSIIRENHSEREIQNIIWFYALLGILLMVVLSLAAFPIQLFYGISSFYKVCIVYSLLLFLNSITKPVEALLNKQFQFKYVAIVGLLTNIIQVVMTYALALMNFSYWALVIPSIMSALITFLAYSSRLKVSLHTPDWSSIRETLKTSKELIANVSGYRILVYCVRNFDNIVVSKIFGLKILGLYSRAFNIAALPVQIVTSVSNDIQYSMLADLKKQGEERVRQEFAQFLRLLGIIGFPVVMIFQVWGHEFSSFVWGRNWNDVGDYLAPLSILIPTNLILYSVSAIFLLERKEKLLFRNSLVSAFGIMSGILIGAFISLKGVIVGLLLGNLFFTIPITGYNVLYKVMQYPIAQIIRVWGINWLIAVLLTVAFIFNLPVLKLVVVGCYGLLFVIRGINYYRLNFVNTR